ncbi:MAG: hypothetical protein AAF378_06960 [Cyanobacteria bacterium P01_A01_bin.84]
MKRLESGIPQAQVQQLKEYLEAIRDLQKLELKPQITRNKTCDSTPRENIDIQRWEAEMTCRLFNYWFTGVELTPNQENFAREEHARYYQTLKEFDKNPRAKEAGAFSMSVNGDGRYIWTGTEAIVLEEKFLKRLENGLDRQQIQQLKENLQTMRRAAVQVTKNSVPEF